MPLDKVQIKEIEIKGYDLLKNHSTEERLRIHSMNTMFCFHRKLLVDLKNIEII